MTMKNRVEKAVELFKSGYNCSQSVVAAFADMYGFTQEQALRMSASFGGGIGRMRQTCGAACGMFLLAGLEKGAVDGKDREGKAANYALVQQLAEEFRKRNGSMICAELLPSLLRLRLLTACYGEVFDEPLAEEGRSIIASWDSTSLTAEQQEAVDEFRNVMDNPYPWEEVE